MSDLFTATASRPLRPHQETAMTLLRQSLAKGKKRVVLQLPTGAGKTRVAAEIVLGARDKRRSVCFTAPAISLIDQTVSAFEGDGVEGIGVIQAKHHRTDPFQPVQVASVQTLARRNLPHSDIVIVDECHMQHKVIGEWMKAEPNKVFIGLTATPWARGMGDLWQDLVKPVTMQELIDAGYLSPFRVFAPSHPDLSNVATLAGDYHEGQLSAVMQDNRLVADVVETWLRRARGLPTLVFAVDLAHAETLQRQFAAAGVRMGYCDASIDLVERQHLFRQMARGDLAGIVNVGTLTTGVDADVRCVVMARPTKSEMLFVQCIGRGLRTAPGKDHCLILDHADNHARLGFVTDIGYDALLTGKEKPEPKTKDDIKPERLPRECPSCGAIKARGPCPACGFEPKRQSEIEYEEGQLIEIAPKAAKAGEPTMQEKADFHAQLLWVADQRHRSRGWAANTYRDKFGVWPVGLAKHVMPKPATPEVLSYVKAKDIRFAKSREARRA
jgi:superfamily II DNA or RNA helicase